MQFQKAKRFILDKLKKELPTQFTYHSLNHVVDVYQAAENLGALENVNEYEMELLLSAALFHDAGFIVGSSSCHEEGSCRIANHNLPGFDYSIDDITKINGMIMATKLPQSPKNHLEEIICDADLDYLGRDDFFPISDCLYNEFRFAGIVRNNDEWNRLQVSFFESHHYFTNSAEKLRKKKKEENLLSIKSKIK